MTDRSLERTRLLLNVVIFLKAHDNIRLGELSAHFDMSEEEMRDLLVREVILAGVPPYSPSDYFNVFFHPSAKGERVSLHKAEEFKRALKLTMPEALALKAMLQSLSQNLDQDLREVVTSLLQKVVDAMQLPPELKDAESHLSLARHSTHLKLHIETIDRALREKSALTIDYFSAAHGTTTRRTIEPLLLFEEASRFYLRAYCRLRKGMRSFRVDRIKDIEVLDEHFECELSIDHVEGAVPGWDGSKAKGRLVVRFEPSVADQVESDWKPRGAKPRRENDGSLILSLPLYSEEWAIGWVLGFGCQAEILKPRHLRDELVHRIKRILATLE